MCCVTSPLANTRPIVPCEWRRRIFITIDGLSHSSNCPTLRAISRRLVWHKMKTDVRNWCQTCHPCQSSKVQRHVHAPLQPRTLPDRHFGSLHVDTVGPLSESKSVTHISSPLLTGILGEQKQFPWQDAVLRHASRVSCDTGYLALAFLVISRRIEAHTSPWNYEPN